MINTEHAITIINEATKELQDILLETIPSLSSKPLSKIYIEFHVSPDITASIDKVLHKTLNEQEFTELKIADVAAMHSRILENIISYCCSKGWVK